MCNPAVKRIQWPDPKCPATHGHTYSSYVGVPSVGNSIAEKAIKKGVFFNSKHILQTRKRGQDRNGLSLNRHFDQFGIGL